MELVSARCTNCGGEIQLDKDKETGYCLHCGSKVVVKDAIKNIRIDNSHLVDNYYTILNSALESGNYSEVEKYCNKIIEITPNDSNAWYLKGKAVGWQSSIQKNRFSESISCWINAIKFCDGDQPDILTDFIEKVEAEIYSLTNAIILMWINRFEEWPDKDVSYGFVDELKNINRSLKRFNENVNKTKIDIDILFSIYLRPINSAFVDTYKNKVVLEYRGEENRPDDYDFSKYIDRISGSAYLLDYLLSVGLETDPVKVLIYKNLIYIHGHAINACSYDYNYIRGNKIWHKSKILNDKAVSVRNELISNYKSALHSLEKKIKIEEEQRKAKEEKKHWEAHPEAYEIYQKTVSELKELRDERENLEIFDFRGKKEISERIKSLEKRMKSLKNI